MATATYAGVIRPNTCSNSRACCAEPTATATGMWHPGTCYMLNKASRCAAALQPMQPYPAHCELLLLNHSLHRHDSAIAPLNTNTACSQQPCRHVAALVYNCCCCCTSCTLLLRLRFTATACQAAVRTPHMRMLLLLLLRLAHNLLRRARLLLHTW
jgi:hypothetical protein